MDLNQIAVRVAGVTMKDPAMQALEKRHGEAIAQIWKGLEDYKKIFEEMDKNRKLTGEVHDFAKTAVADVHEMSEKVRSWGDDFRSIKQFLGEEED